MEKHSIKIFMQVVKFVDISSTLYNFYDYHQYSFLNNFSLFKIFRYDRVCIHESNVTLSVGENNNPTARKYPFSYRFLIEIRSVYSQIQRKVILI